MPPDYVRLMERRPVVLVVDDEEHIADVIALVLEEEGYRVLRALNGEDGLALAREHRPDLVITDLMMPRVDGDGLIAELRTDPSLRAAPILVVSCIKPPGIRGRVEGYLAKPFEIDDMVEQVRRLCPIKSNEGPRASIGENTA